MSGSYYRIDGLDDMEKKLLKMIQQDFPEEFKQLLLDMAHEICNRAKERTKRRTGRLQDAWRVGNVKQRGSEWVVEIINDVDYAEPVEYGHRTRGGAFVPGQHMLELSLAEAAERLPGYLDAWMSDFLSRHNIF